MKNAPNIYRNMSLRAALRMAEDFGCRVKKIPNTDEVRVDSPRHLRPLRIKCTRKDSTAQLISVLRQLSRSVA